MKAWVSGEKRGLANIVLQNDLSLPTGELVIDVHAAAVNFSDLLMLEDQYQVKPPRPFILGQEVAGVVSKAAGDFAIGDHVMSKVTWGGFADAVAVNANMPIRIPKEMGFAEAAAMPVSYTTAMVGLTECANLTTAKTLLVLAASGAVGLAAVQVAAASNAMVIAAASTDEKCAVAKANGADHVVNYSHDDWIQTVKSLTEGRGCDLIFDPVGGDLGEAAVRILARDGTLLIVGFASGSIQSLPANRLLLKRASAKGVYWNHDQDHEMLARCNDRIFELLKSHQLKPLITRYRGLESLPQALEDLLARRSVGKLVVEMVKD